jgi:GDP-D-mannose dehydratase
MFTYEGPTRGETVVTTKITRAVAAIETWSAVKKQRKTQHD